MIKDDKLSDVIGTLHRLTSAIFNDAIQRKLILDNLTEAVFTVDMDLEVTSFNKAAESLTGIPEKEAIGKNCTELFDSPTGEKDFCIVEEVLKGKEPITKVTRHLLIKDRLLPVMVSASPLTDKNGKIVGGVQSFQEIQKLFQRQLVLDSVFSGVFTVDLDFKITMFNKAAESLTGFRQEDVLGRPFFEIFYPFSDQSERTSLPLIRAINEKKPIVKQSNYIQSANGSLLPVSIRATPLLNARGELIGGVENFHDNTDKIQTDLILDHVIDGVFTTDRDGVITSFNKAAEKITGYRAEEAIGKRCHDIFFSDQCRVRMGQLSHDESRPEPWIDKHIYLKLKGERVIPVSMSSVPMFDPQGNILGMVQTFRDVTNELQSQFVLDSVADGVFTIDENFIITSFNRAAEKITGYTAKDAIGRPCRQVLQASICSSDCPMVKALNTKAKTIAQNVSIRGRQGRMIPVSLSATALVDDEGNVIGGVGAIRDLTEVTELRRKLSSDSKRSGILSRSPKMQRILSVLPEFAKSDSNIMVLGESGTGKELIALSIHKLSNRRDKPFVAVNSGALPDTLLESELFGYKAGAFTDAKRDKKGRFAAAEKGTLFLDEIGDISLAMQVKLLRVIQTRTYEPLGSNTPVKMDVRIIAATNKNLEEMVKRGTFREDLYYRLNVVKIELPPLRERMEDIPLLVEHFVEKFNRQRNRHVKGISEDALSLLMKHDYPGNIRELENIIEYAFILCHDGLILPQHLPEWMTGHQKEHMSSANKGAQTLKDIEKNAIIEALNRNAFKKMKTCRELGISKDTLRRKLKIYGITVP